MFLGSFFCLFDCVHDYFKTKEHTFIKFFLGRAFLFIYLFVVLLCFHIVQVISRWVVLWLEETSTYSSRFCTVNCRPSVSNYQLSHIRSRWGTTALPWPHFTKGRSGLDFYSLYSFTTTLTAPGTVRTTLRRKVWSKILWKTSETCKQVWLF